MNSPERPSEATEAVQSQLRFNKEWNRQFESLSQSQRESVIGSPLGLTAEHFAASVKAALARDPSRDRSGSL